MVDAFLIYYLGAGTTLVLLWLTAVAAFLGIVILAAKLLDN